MKRIDLSGLVVGRLTVKSYVGQSKWECVCSCGVIKNVASYSLRKHLTQSCGCLHSDVTRARNSIHNNHGTRAYRIWSNMKDRCSNPLNKAYHRYGGRGITVTPRWLEFKNFLEDMGQPPENRTLDRIDNDKGYSPENCRWATISDQARNRFTTTSLEAFGEKKSFTEWAKDERCQVNLGTLRQRVVAYGWSVERALATPSQVKKE